MAEALGSTKTFKMTQWGTLERQATAKNDKPLGLGIKDDKKRGKFEVKLVYSRRTAKNLLEQQRKMLDRKFTSKKSNVHEAFNSVALLDYLDPSERHVGNRADPSENSCSLSAWSAKSAAHFPHL